jgi:pSer/pThr/pTyr-binding forkhead associated (FHA) protein
VSRPSAASGETVQPRANGWERTVRALVVFCAAGRPPLTFSIREGDAVIGREPGLAVFVPKRGISRHHAKLTWDGASYWIEDLDSRNGTFVNGLPVPRKGRERLRHLDRITLGRAIELLFLTPADRMGVVKREGVLEAALLGEGSGTPKYAIGAGGLTLGRSAANDVVFEGDAVSKLHARIQRTREHVVVQDLGSANGTYVNGARVVTALLQDGDRLSLAGDVTYRVKMVTGEVRTIAEMRGAPLTSGHDRRRPSGDGDTLWDWDADEEPTVQRPQQDRRETAEEPTQRRPAPPPAIASPSPVQRVHFEATGVDLSIGEPGLYVLGRLSTASLRITHPTVSRLQARITLSPDRTEARVEPTGTSATLLNGVVMSGAARLGDGDRLQVGDVVLSVRFEY